MNIADAPPREARVDFAAYRPHPAPSVLAQWLEEAHALTRRLFAVVDGARLRVPLSPVVNPPLWELGHIGYFHEFWVHRRGDFDAPSIVPGADCLYDSARVAHDSRWTLELPDIDATWRNVETIRERTLELLDRGLGDELAYFVQLGILHHDMHNEAFCYMWHTLGYPAPLPVEAAAPAGGDCPGDAEIPAGSVRLGADPASGFVFDNEKWAHEADVPAFSIARRAVSNGEFLAFVEDDGYSRRGFWSEEGWRMRDRFLLEAPRYWRKDRGRWHLRRYDRVLPLDPREPVVHVSWHEAKAYCRWAGRRLPTEAEWERAAASAPGADGKRRFPWGDEAKPGLARLDARAAAPAPVDAFARGESAWGVRQMLGNVWEWTESRFAPYPGFSADPYREYSEPWFAEDHRVLRGGSFATPLRLVRNTWRNFYKPDRADVFCGFRTCAL